MRFLSFILVMVLSVTASTGVANAMQISGERITTQAGSITFSELIYLSATHKTLSSQQALLASELISLSRRCTILQNWNVFLTVSLVSITLYAIYQKRITPARRES